MNSNKRRGLIQSVEVVNGIVVCDVEDADEPGLEYPKAIFGNITSNFVSVPQKGAEVLVEQYGGDYVITHVLSIPTETGMDESAVEDAAENQRGSMSFVFGPREGASSVEKFSIQHTDTGYEVEMDVDGAINIVSENENINITAQQGDLAVTAQQGDLDVTAQQGDLNVEAQGGNVTISEGGTAKKLLTEDAVFEYVDDGSTKTTSTVANGETTEVEID